MKRKYIFLAAIAAVCVVLDQLSKLWARGLALKPPVAVIDSFFHFIYVENRGAAWSLFADLSPTIRVPFFIGVSLVAVGLIFLFFRRIREDQTRLVLALSLVLGGALGNLVDRIVRGSVIDFIDWHVGRHHWPTFNVADIFITIGVGLLILEMLFGKSELSLFGASGGDRRKSP